MTKFDALMVIVGDQYIRRRRPVDYRRMKRALLALGLSKTEQDAILAKVEYHDASGQPYKWAA